MDNQMSFQELFEPKDFSGLEKKLEVVYAEYKESRKTNWQELFEGFNELYAITFSSGMQFVSQIVEQLDYSEIIFGCENIVEDGFSVLMASQIANIKNILKGKSAARLANKIENNEMKLFVSRDTKSHEKIFILKAQDGRTRVITGSANMSASAFCGLQRENILCFDDLEAFHHYMDIFETFREQCADYIALDTVQHVLAEPEYFDDNIAEVPIVKTIEKKQIVVIEDNRDDQHEEAEIVVNIKGLEKELKPMLPKPKKENGKILLTGDMVRSFKKKYKPYREEKLVRQKRLPKLHLDYETRSVKFNDKEIDMQPSEQQIDSDIKCLLGYLNSLNCFYGDYEQSQKDYYAFLNWYFLSPFLPYLRYVANRTNYDMTPFPVVGIIYGDSNGGKSTFVRLLSKLMCGKKLPINASSDFTSTQIENLKRGCEGIPINIDDLAKSQFSNHGEKVIKDDEWGLREGFINYPAVVITTNKLAALPQDISKRTVTCHINTRLDKEEGAKNSKKINESMKTASNAFFAAYASRMFVAVLKMEEDMKASDDNYFPDIFAVSSEIICNMIKEHCETVPQYVRTLNYSDYFGAKAIGRTAMQKIMTAWKNEPKQFHVDKRNNKLIYSYPEQGRFYELAYIHQELPPALNAQLTARSIVMDLDVAREVFGCGFRKKFFVT